MVVGVCVMDLHLPGCQSLKEKRRVLKSVIGRLQSRLNVAVAEIDFQDTWQQASLGICTIANSGARVDEVLAQAARLVESESRLQVIRISTERR